LFDDVGPRTVVRLDEIMHSVEVGRPVTTKYRRDVWRRRSSSWKRMTAHHDCEMM
jgi:hypothetical protein